MQWVEFGSHCRSCAEASRLVGNVGGDVTRGAAVRGGDSLQPRRASQLMDGCAITLQCLRVRPGPYRIAPHHRNEAWNRLTEHSELRPGAGGRLFRWRMA